MHRVMIVISTSFMAQSAITIVSALDENLFLSNFIVFQSVYIVLDAISLGTVLYLFFTVVYGEKSRYSIRLSTEEGKRVSSSSFVGSARTSTANSPRSSRISRPRAHSPSSAIQSVRRFSAQTPSARCSRTPSYSDKSDNSSSSSLQSASASSAHTTPTARKSTIAQTPTNKSHHSSSSLQSASADCSDDEGESFDL